MNQAKKRLRNDSFIPLRYQRWPCTLQPSWNSSKSSKFYALLRLRIALILQFRYQRWPCTKQPSWKSSNNIFQPIFPLEHKIDGSLQSKWGPRIALIIPFRYERWPSTKQPCWNASDNIFFQTICPHEQKLNWICHAKKKLRNASFIPLRC